MRKTFAFLAVGLGAVALASQTGDALLGQFQKALSSANSLHAKYTVQPVGGAPSRYVVTLEKPNKASIVGPQRTIVADGTTITVHDKATNEYSKRQQTETELKALFTPEELNVWSGFFNPSAYRAYNTKEKGLVDSEGRKLKAVEALYDSHGHRTVTYYLDPESNVARQARIDIHGASGRASSVLSASELALGTVPANAFAFQPPAGSKEVSWEDMNALKWITDLEEGKRIAQRTGKKIFVDFMAEWCGPCKDLERDVFKKPEFRKYAAKLVLVKIDVDKQKHVSQAYQIEAMPTQMVLDPYGKVIQSTVGYGGPAAFYKFLDGALAR